MKFKKLAKMIHDHERETNKHRVCRQKHAAQKQKTDRKSTVWMKRQHEKVFSKEIEILKNVCVLIMGKLNTVNKKHKGKHAQQARICIEWLSGMWDKSEERMFTNISLKK